MPIYRVQLLEAGGQHLSSQLLDCRDDDDAIDRAGRTGHAGGIDVWSEGRLVGRFLPPGGGRFDLGRG
jgi:hypothetical protein